jgi:hypothetical protein
MAFAMEASRDGLVIKLNRSAYETMMRTFFECNQVPVIVNDKPKLDKNGQPSVQWVPMARYADDLMGETTANHWRKMWRSVVWAGKSCSKVFSDNPGMVGENLGRKQDFHWDRMVSGSSNIRFGGGLTAGTEKQDIDGTSVQLPIRDMFLFAFSPLVSQFFYCRSLRSPWPSDDSTYPAYRAVVTPDVVSLTSFARAQRRMWDAHRGDENKWRHHVVIPGEAGSELVAACAAETSMSPAIAGVEVNVILPGGSSPSYSVSGGYIDASDAARDAWQDISKIRDRYVRAAHWQSHFDGTPWYQGVGVALADLQARVRSGKLREQSLDHIISGLQFSMQKDQENQPLIRAIRGIIRGYVERQVKRGRARDKVVSSTWYRFRRLHGDVFRNEFVSTIVGPGTHGADATIITNAVYRDLDAVRNFVLIALCAEQKGRFNEQKE